MLGKYQQTLHITLNSIISLGAGVPHADVSRLSIDISIRLLPVPIEQITHILPGKSLLLIQNLAQILHFSAADLENGIKHSFVDGV
jgi:hypothetical protein